MDRPVTLVTGSRKGIGRFLAEHYVRQGHAVVGCSRGACDWELDGYQHHTLDVADESAVVALFQSVRKQFGRLDNLINNAGAMATNHSLLTPLKAVQSMLNTNVVGTFLFSREAAKLMKEAGGGRIVNFSTVAVPLKVEGEAVYAASKAAVTSLTHILAREFAPMKITVNAIGPTPIVTDMIRALPKAKLDKVIASQPIKRLGTQEDVSNVVDFFLRKESEFITGQVIYLGGV